ncbi:MAG: HAD hydrolase family protein [Clostridia bacterium]|nr:HAD hydrolase family protein [Clostridia bacterium]
MKTERIFEHIAIVTDLDGTFFGAGAQPPEANLQAIAEFCARGGQFTYGTGRMHKNIARVLPQSGTLCTLPAVVCNGSYLLDFATGERLYPTSMPTADVVAVAKYAREIAPKMGVRVVTPDGFMTDGCGVDIVREMTRNPADFPHVLPIGQWTDANPAGQWFKLVFRGEAEELVALRPCLAERFGDRFEYAVSGPRFLELTVKGCSKASGIARLKQLYREREGHDLFVVACGDQENDLAMLKAADIAFCPENAIDEVKEVCKATLCHHTEGIMPEVVKRIQNSEFRIRNSE